jgi:hypothetical protein
MLFRRRPWAMTRLITDFRHGNRDESGVIMTKIGDKWVAHE